MWHIELLGSCVYLQLHGQVFFIIYYMYLVPGYREIVMQSLPQISVLDDLDRLGNPSRQGLVSPCDVPGLEDYMDLLLSSDTSHTEVVVLAFILTYCVSCKLCGFFLTFSNCIIGNYVLLCSSGYNPLWPPQFLPCTRKKKGNLSLNCRSKRTSISKPPTSATTCWPIVISQTSLKWLSKLSNNQSTRASSPFVPRQPNRQTP